MRKRLFYILSLLLVSLLTLAACGGQDTVQEEETNQEETATTVAEAAGDVGEAMPAVSARGFIEVPFLADRVASGELPPIDERLPEDVFVVGPGVLLQEEYQNWEDGQYGGDISVAATFHTGFLNIAGGATILRSPSQTTEASLPNVVKDVTISDDYTTYTFELRKGLRWSDGVELTTEDVRFTFEDLYNHPDVQRPFPSELFTQGNSELGAAELTIVDEYNFELKFSEPYGMFVAVLNSWIPYYDIIFKPSHYLKQFHADYADADELGALVEASGEAGWVQLLNNKDVVHWDIGADRALGMPVLNAWVLTEIIGERHIFERNPYFWHVDASGHQLPYLDRYINDIAIDPDAQTNAILAGQVSIATGGETALNKMPVYQQNVERSNLNVFTTGSFNYPILLFLNHDYEYDNPDSAWQQLIADPERRFGQAIAAAIDPVEINQSVFFGLFGEPFLNNKDHNPDLANQNLDALGMSERGDDGFRLDPNGETFIFRIVYSTAAADFAPVAELLKEQLEEVGLRVELENVDGSLFDQRKSANEIAASLFWNDGTAWAGGISEDYLPNHKGPWSPMTWQYFTSNGAVGRVPPSYIQEFYDLHTARKEFPPQSPEGEAIFNEMLQWMSDNYVFIPVTGLRAQPNVVDADLRNVPLPGAPFELDTYILAESYWFADQ